MKIHWAGFTNEVKLDLYKAGVHVKTIRYSEPKEGNYLWKIPEELSSTSDYQVRVKNRINTREIAWSGIFRLNISNPGSNSLNEKANITSKLVAYPNPFTDQIRIEIVNAVPKQGLIDLLVRIFNSSGQQVMEQRSHNPVILWDGSINNRGKVKPGIYLIQVLDLYGNTAYQAKVFLRE